MTRSKRARTDKGTSRPARSGPHIFLRVSPAVPTKVYDTYWQFAVERQRAFFRRLEGKPAPWTTDSIIREYRFTNAYRASDRVSQFLIKRVIYRGDQSFVEIFFRTLLFKLFNRIETWTRLEAEIGMPRWSDYEFAAYDRVLTKALARGERIYSSAYIMPSPRQYGYARKHQNHLKLLEALMADEVPERIASNRTMREGFALLLSYSGLGNFLAYQYMIDLNYSELLRFSEMEFVVPGPGARDGIRKCFASLGGLNEADIIRMVTDRQLEEFEHLGLSFRTLWGRSLQLIDCQNLFCEVDKYARIAHPDVRGRSGRKRIKRRYTPNPEAIVPWYPPKWGLNRRLAEIEGGHAVRR